MDVFICYDLVHVVMDVLDPYIEICILLPVPDRYTMRTLDLASSSVYEYAYSYARIKLEPSVVRLLVESS